MGEIRKEDHNAVLLRMMPDEALLNPSLIKSAHEVACELHGELCEEQTRLEELDQAFISFIKDHPGIEREAWSDDQIEAYQAAVIRESNRKKLKSV